MLDISKNRTAYIAVVGDTLCVRHISSRYDVFQYVSLDFEPDLSALS